LSKKIKDQYEIISEINNNKEGEDGMFTKRNFGPMNCASCEKNIVNIQGM
jgi:hypothetical protein